LATTTLVQLAEYVVGLRAAAVPLAVLDALRLHLFDTLGAALAGGTIADGQVAAAVAADAGGPGAVSAVGLGIRTTAPLAALAASAATRCTEVDDIHLESCTTPGSVVVPTALALAQMGPELDAEAFLASLLAGYELLTRFGRAVDGPNVLYRGVWPTYLAAGFGAATVAARLLGLGVDQTTHALSTALGLAAGTSLRGPSPSARWLTLGCAVQNGVLAALAARRGFHGDPALLDGAWSTSTGLAVDGAALLDGLGDTHVVERVSIKPYCAAKQATGAIAAFVALLDEERLEPAAIDEVVVAVPPRYAGMIDQPMPPADRMGTIVSAQHGCALAAFHRDDLLDVARTTARDEPAFRALRARIRVEAEPGLAATYPAAWPARVTVWTGGATRTREVQHTPGDPGQPFGWDDVGQKVQRLLRGIVAPAAIDQLAATCRALGVGATLADLLEGLRPLTP
jgi:2-methylcitrate dehydratase PrpD